MPADPALVEAIAAASERAVPPSRVDVLHGWRLRHAGAGIRRADSVMAARFDAGADLAAALDAVEAWYRLRDLPACFQITPRTQPEGLDAVLARRGYACLTPVAVMARPLGPGANPIEASAGASEGLLRLEADLTPAVLDVLSDGVRDGTLRRAREALFARIRPAYRTALLTLEGRLIASGFCVVDLRMAGLFSLHTAPARRRSGLSTRVIAALLSWARSEGAAHAWLQVEDANAPALALYRRLGFEAIDRYWYRERATGPSST